MNSIKLHLSEKILSLSIFLTFLFLIGLYTIPGAIPAVETIAPKEWITFGLFAICFAITAFSYFYFKRWRRIGENLSDELGLGSLVIFHTTLTTEEERDIFELHHKPASYSQGRKLRSQPKHVILQDMQNDFTYDFTQLAGFCETTGAQIITITHDGMAQIWRTAAEGLFEIKETKVIRDPFVKPSWFNWLMLSISTTGRISKKPKYWRSYVFTLRRDNFSDGMDT